MQQSTMPDSPARCDVTQLYPAKGTPLKTPPKSTPTARRNSKKAKDSVKPTPERPARSGAARTVRSSAPPVLAVEDPRAYRGRLKSWSGTLEPRNPIELYLVERAVTLSWQLDRADYAQVAQLTRIAGSLDGNSLVEDADGMATRVMFDESEAGERLRQYQLACGQALFRTLDAFSMLRGLGEGVGRALTVPAAPIAAAAPIPAAGDQPAGVASPAAAIPAKDHGPDREERSTAAVLADLLGPAAEPLTPRVPPAPSRTAPGIADRRVDRIAGEEVRSGRAAGSSDHGRDETGDGTESPSHIRPSTRRRLAARSGRRSSFSGSGGPGTDGAEGVGAMSHPIRRPPPRPEVSPNPPDSRRRVGGYEVPMDPSVTVACADRIPVRLRREAAASRLARPSGHPAN